MTPFASGTTAEPIFWHLAPHADPCPHLDNATSGHQSYRLRTIHEAWNYHREPARCSIA
jgi:hypothetical protein